MEHAASSTRRSVTAAALVLALLGFVSVAAARTWTSRDGKFSIDATLVDFKGGQVTLKKDDGSTINVPLSKLSAKDRQYIKKQYPAGKKKTPQAGNDLREWKSRDGKFTIRAKLLDYSKGKVHLEKADGKEIVVPIGKLSAKDRYWVEREMRRRRKAQGQSNQPSESEEEQAPDWDTQPKPDHDEEITEPLGLQTVDMKLVRLKLGNRKKPDALTQYVLGMTRQQGLFILMAKNPYEAKFKRIVQKEPDYAMKQPLRAMARFGPQNYPFALDAVGKKPKGFNRLYLDTNRNGDLTDDTPIDALGARGKVLPGAGSIFPRIDLPLKIDGAEVKHPFHMQINHHGNPKSGLAIIRFGTAAVRQGEICQGKRKIRIMLVDANSNGRFDDRVSVRNRGARLSVSQGDLLLVNPNPRSRRSGSGPMSRDSHLVSKTVCIGRHFYKMDVSPTGDQVKLQPTELTMGYVTNASPTYRATVYSDDYGALMIGGVKDQKIPMPEGRWKLADYTIDATAFTGGKRTTVMASFSDEAQEVSVSNDNTVELPFGAPFRAVVTAGKPRPKDKKTPLHLSVVGKGGERCTRLYIKGKEPPEPRFEVRDKDGKVVYQGKFKWG